VEKKITTYDKRFNLAAFDRTDNGKTKPIDGRNKSPINLESQSKSSGRYNTSSKGDILTRALE